MPTQISQDNIQPATLAALGGPTLTNVQITDASYAIIDDTAVLLSGGYIKLTGTKFVSGCQVILGSANATSVTFVNSTTLNVQVPAQVAGTYVVYVVNPDGGVAIRVNGLTYSGNPTWVTGSTLPDQPANTAISIQLETTGDSPLTYAVQAGSSLPSGVSLSSSGLITGLVAVGVETLYNFTIEAIDVELQESPRAFTVTITIADPFFKNVTTLISANSPATSVFVDDASTNNFPVSIFGDTRPNNFGPYTPGYYSNFFDGTGDFISNPGNVAFNLSSGSWTVECWFYQTSSKQVQLISSGAARWRLDVNTSQQVTWLFNTGSSQLSNNTAPLNQWNHVAMCYDGTTNILYLNGVAQTATGALVPGSDNASTFYIGRNPDAGSGWDFNGYISNVRIVKGSAVYTANFTPPTVPLTAIAGTTLLTCQSNRFIDNSTNNFALTVNGNLAISGFDPFVPNTSYSGYGSTYFDGTGDFLTAQSMTLGTSAFTIEFWAYPTSIPTNAIIFGTTTNGGIQLQTDSGGNLNIGTYGVGNTIATSGSPFVTNRWLHIVAVRSGTGANQTSIFFNGVRNVNGTVSTNYVAGPATIGGAASQMFFGYISNFRVVIGTAVYDPTQTTLTVPTEPLTAIAGTSLLTCQTNQPVNNNVFIDNSTNNFLITRNGNTTQGTFSPYGGGWSNYFDGTGDYLSIPDNAAFTLGTNDFTFECWVYPTSITSGNNNILAQWGTGNAWIFRYVAAGRLQFSGAATNVTGTTTAVVINQWNHVAITRSSSTVRLFVNGVLDATTGTIGALTDGASQVTVGAYSDGTSEYVTGYISNLRLVKGTALYTANFTPSTAPLQPIAGTSLLTCARNRLVDASPNNFAVTKAGDVSVQKFSPFTETSLPTPYYSNYFDGTGDYLTVPSNAAFNITSGSTDSFSCELWVNFATVSANRTIIDNGGLDTVSFSNWAIYLNASSQIAINWGASGAPGSSGIGVLPSSTVPVAGQWYHLALVKTNADWALFINGTRATSFNGLNTAAKTSASALYIGFGIIAGGGGHVGYISNVRIYNGATGSAPYAATSTTITVPTEPLTAIAGTSLLTCQSNTFIDNSTNNFAITAVGNTIPSQFAPFNVAYTTRQRYTPQVFGGSSRFDGTNDWIGSAQTNTTSVMNFASGQDFTMELWVYSTSGLADYTIANYGTYKEAYNSERVIWITNKSASIFISGGSNTSSVQYTALFPSSATLSTNSWNHIALVRSSNFIKVYVNGVGGTAVSAPGAAQPLSSRYDLAGPNGLWLGVNSTNWTAFNPVGVTGYISDFRYVKGTALYTSNFVPQNTPLTAVRNTVLLINGTGAGVYDSSGLNNYETVGDAKIDTTVVKFTGTESVKFDGNGDSLTYIGGASINFGTGDFTIELWVNMANTSTFSSFLRPDDGGSVVSFGYDWSTTQLKLDARNAVILNVTTTAVVANTWTHIAATRSGTSLRLFVNGTQVGSTTSNSTNFASATGLIYIGGSSFSAAHSVNGYISDFRITLGIARYTANFTPPTGVSLTQ